MGLHKDCCFSMIPQKWAGNLLGDITAGVDVPIQRYQKHFWCLCAWILTMILTILMSFYRDAMVRQIQASLYISILTLTTLEVHIKSCLTWELVLKCSLVVSSVFFCFKCTGKGFIESSTPAALPLAVDKEPIRLLDLSGNELGNLSCLMGVSALKQQIENLLRLDLSSNNLSEFPSVLCQVCRNILTVVLKQCY